MTQPRTTRDGDLTPAGIQQIEAVCDHFEAGWGAGRPPRIEDELGAVIEPLRSALLRELLVLELTYRRLNAEQPVPDDYVARFPDRTEAIRSAFEAVLAPGSPPCDDSQDDLAPSGAATKCSTTAGPALPDSSDATDPGDEVHLPTPFGRYHVLKRLGQGGMGTVYLAHDVELDRPVALKVPHLGFGRDRQTLERFRREARTAASFRHPNFCPIYDVGQVGQVRYLAMAFIEGETLAALIDRVGPLPPRRAVEMVHTLAEALAEAHRRGVVHRDLKPANVMIDARGALFIMDFGLALGPGSGLALTLTGVPLGTPRYMSPEQADGRRQSIGPATDIYSLGMTLHELLTDHRPPEGPMSAALDRTDSSSTLPSKGRNGFDLDPELEGICCRAMAKEIADRYPSMDAFAEALRAYLSRTAGAAPARLKPVRPRASWKQAVAIGILALMAAGVAILLLLVLRGIRSKEGGGHGDDVMTNSVGVQFRLIPAGWFDAGSPDPDLDSGADEGPRHRVQISKPFYLGVHELTQGQARQILGPDLSRSRGPDLAPVESISWSEAIWLCNRLSAREGLPGYYRIDGDDVQIRGGHGYRLPTEAEWEYACRAGSTTPFALDNPARLGEYAWFRENSRVEGTCVSHLVGQRRPNAFGLHDMHGNVWEWCWDRYGASYYRDAPVGDPAGPDSGPTRVLRGGSFDDEAGGLTSANRYHSPPGIRHSCWGLRLAKSIR